VTKIINLTLKIWRQKGSDTKGQLETYHASNISTDMSFLEMIDIINEQLTLDGKNPIAFDHDCREGICGMCGAVVNGRPHGPEKGTTLCQLHMRHFSDGDTVVIEPWRSKAFPVIKDLAVDRSAMDQIIQAGGYISVNTGGAMLFTGAKISHLTLLPQGKPEAARRALAMISKMDGLGFGNCTNERECEAECPKEISITNIARLNREFIKAGFFSSIM